MNFPPAVRMVEVGPRDGLQNEPVILPASIKAELINRLADAGLKTIEAGSFVSPKLVPQLADTAEVLARIERRAGVCYPVLVPNMKGFDAAMVAGVEEIAIFAAASEKFSEKNINCSIAESLERFAPVCAAALKRNIRVRGYVSCVMGCPYQGKVEAADVASLAGRLADLGCYEISLGDTVGVGTPGQAAKLVDAVAARVPVERLAAHFHDTRGQALANILAVMGRGIAVIDSAVAGLGGCPFAANTDNRAAGNVASEDVLYMLNGLGIDTGVDFDALVEAGRFVSDHLGHPPASRANLAQGSSC
jgi:isopropylmalate/homocitrate/citramalate synthase